MLPSIAMLIAFIAVAGCCVYISYRIGQVISPSSRMLQQRFAELEAAVGRSETDIRQALDRHREATGEEARRLLDDGVRASEAQAQFVRRGLDDFGERLNGARLDFARDSTQVREEVRSTLVGLQASTRENTQELARLQSDTLGNLSGQIGTLGSESERRQERAMAALEAISSELKAIYATGASELRERVASDLTEARTSLAQLATAIADQGMQVAQTIAGQGAQLDGVEQTITGALRESAGSLAALSTAIEGKQVALNASIVGKQDDLIASIGRKHDASSAAIELQFAKFRDEASGQLAQLLAVDERLEDSWAGVKSDFDAVTRSLVQISRAIDILKNELTVKLQDGGGSTGVDGLFERVLQPNEFERDVEIEPGTNQRVAFAVRLSDNPMTHVWLPVGTLPVVQGYNEFVAATVYSDVEGIRSSSEAFERAVAEAAEDLSSKFVCPPRTLNLAVLLAPSDDLYAEIARRDSLVDAVRRNFNVMIAGPATLPTLLTGLRMAFKGTSTGAVKRSNGPLAATLAGEGSQVVIKEQRETSQD